MASTSIKRLVTAGVVASSLVLLGSRVMADTAADIEQFYSLGTAVTYDNASGDYPVITAILSKPGLSGGHQFTSYSFLAEDSSGSLDIFVATNVLSAVGAGGYGGLAQAPAVGDMLSASGQWSPFSGIPEMGFVTVPASNNSITKISSGNAVPAPTVTTVAQLTNLVTGGLMTPTTFTAGAASLAGTYVQLNNVTITPSSGNATDAFATTFPMDIAGQNTVGNETYNMTDSSGTMIMFDQVTSYSMAAAMGGSAVPTAPVTIYGVVDDFAGTAEFIPIKIVPEPSTFAMAAAGLLGCFTLLRKRRK